MGTKWMKIVLKAGLCVSKVEKKDFLYHNTKFIIQKDYLC